MRVNSVNPGFIGTAMVSSGVDSMSEPEGLTFEERIMARVPMGRRGESNDIADVILTLALEDSNYMNGSELAIDGGCIARQAVSVKLNF